MATTFRCENPACRKLLRVREGLAGKRVKCPGCGRVMAAPAGGGPPAEAPGPPVRWTRLGPFFMEAKGAVTKRFAPSVCA
jgi:hypothetical protein